MKLLEVLRTVTSPADPRIRWLTRRGRTLLRGFFTVFDEQVSLPCVGKALDVEVEVLGFDLEGDERRSLVALCRRMAGVLAVSLADWSCTGLTDWSPLRHARSPTPSARLRHRGR